ncbi:hypothetical protein Patl1_36175 [Pistacia atlantica]|nr:hypothetical protein Patl1_36175 [Pistacia atlantica]
MASTNSEIVKEFRFFRVYKDGRIELFSPPCPKVPPSDDPVTGVRSKDVTISSEPPVSARIFIPKVSDPNQKFPLLFLVHGGGFCVMSAFAPRYHLFCNTVSAQAGAVIVSVEYGLFPDRPIPACYEDSWAALHGVSAGGNISHTLAFRVGSIGLPGVKAEDLAKLGCERVLIFVAEKDHLNVVGKNYHEDLKKSGWGGRVELFESHGEEHVFHMDNPKSEKAVEVTNNGFSMMSAFSPHYHNFCSRVLAQAGVIVVSIEYGLFPERRLPAYYEDSWVALQWVESHVGGNGPEPWLNDQVNFKKVFFGGDSSVHPFFGGAEDDEMWLFMNPIHGGLKDPKLKPHMEDLAKLGSERVLIFVAEKDDLNIAGKNYYEELKKSGWKGRVELVENHGGDHCFHLRHPPMKRLCS